MNSYTTQECLNTPVPSWEEIEKETSNRKNIAERELRQKVENEYQKKQSALFEKWHVDFIFGKDQYDEYVSKQRALGYQGEFVGLSRICSGMIAREDTAIDFVKELSSLHDEWKKAKRNAWNMDAYIEHSMWNHEVFYTSEWLDENMVSDVRYYFPEAKESDFKRVYKNVQRRQK